MIQQTVATPIAWSGTGPKKDLTILRVSCTYLYRLHHLGVHLCVQLGWRCSGRRCLINEDAQRLADHPRCQIHGDDDGTALKPVRHVPQGQVGHRNRAVQLPYLYLQSRAKLIRMLRPEVS